MPELPDLEVFSKNLTKRFGGKTLKKISIANKSKVKTPEKSFKKLEGEKLKEVYREGKELRFLFGKQTIGMHLMLNGNLYLLEDEKSQKNQIMQMVFTNDDGFALTDWQRAANITLNPEEKTAPDALSEEVNASLLKQKTSKSRTNIKNLLMDQKFIRGIGNAYADEILYNARIHPLSVCNKIPDARITVLAKSIKKVLLNAVKYIEKHHPDLISGEVRDFLPIHHHKKKKSPGGFPIKKTEVNKRITYYTDEQNLFA